MEVVNSNFSSGMLPVQYEKFCKEKITQGTKKNHGKTWHEELSDKAASLRTHIYWCIQNCNNSPENLRKNIANISEHYKGNHKECHSSSRCKSDPAYESTKNAARTPEAEKMLKDFLLKLQVYKNAEDYCYCKDTHYVESFNNSLLQYHDKRIVFNESSYKMRINLSIIDWNEHVDRPVTSRQTVFQDMKAPRQKLGSKESKEKPGQNQNQMVMVEIDGYSIRMPIALHLKERLASVEDNDERKEAVANLVEMARRIIAEMPSQTLKEDADGSWMGEDQTDYLPDIEDIHNDENVMPVSTATTSQGTGLFTVEQTRFILQSYSSFKEKFQSPNHKKKALWKDITSWVNDHYKPAFTASQVEGRWKTQLAAYQGFKDDQQKSGRERKEFLYKSELDDIMRDCHDVSPVSTLQSLPSAREAEDINKPGVSGEKRSIPESDCTLDQVKRKKKKVTKNNGMLEFVKEYTEIQKHVNDQNLKKLEEMHHEKISVLKDLLGALSKK